MLNTDYSPSCYAVMLFWGVKCLLLKFSLSRFVCKLNSLILARETINMHNNNVPLLLLLLLCCYIPLNFYLCYHTVKCLLYIIITLYMMQCVFVRERKKNNDIKILLFYTLWQGLCNLIYWYATLQHTRSKFTIVRKERESEWYLFLIIKRRYLLSRLLVRW